ncbi:MAG: bifunctional phosphoglucose/phosphomannose isomerase [Candidatus Woesearchaeota archaeon]
MENKLIDKSNMIEVLRNFPNMFEEAINLGDDITFPKEFVENIAILGMGGSGFTGDLINTYLNELPMKIFVIKDYDLPNFIQKKSLVFAISYSGNTEETITAYRAAIRRGCRVVAISSGGKLEELSKMNKNPYIKVPKGVQPRLAIPYLLVSILNVLSYSGIIDEQEETIKKLVSYLKRISIEEEAKLIAKKLKNKVPIIYSSQRLFSIAEKWKTDINENAKTHAFYNVFPEFNHNEICAYENNITDSHIKTHLILITDKDDYLKIKDRINVFKKLLNQYKVSFTELGLVGDNFLTRLIVGVWTGLFVSYYLALEYERDPTPVNIIEKFKKELK